MSPVYLEFGLESVLLLNQFNSGCKCVRKEKARQTNCAYSIALESRHRKVQGLQMVVQNLNKRMRQVEHMLLYSSYSDYEMRANLSKKFISYHASRK